MSNDLDKEIGHITGSAELIVNHWLFSKYIFVLFAQNNVCNVQVSYRHPFRGFIS